MTHDRAEGRGPRAEGPDPKAQIPKRKSQSDSRIPHAARRTAFTIEVDGEPLPAYEGETLAAVLWAAGRRCFHRAAEDGPPRSVFCGMGSCFNCLVTVDGEPNVRACMTLARPGMKVELCSDQSP